MVSYLVFFREIYLDEIYLVKGMKVRILVFEFESCLYGNLFIVGGRGEEKNFEVYFWN